MAIGGDLRLGGNQIASLPASMGTMTIEGDLWLDNNQIASLPASIGTMPIGGDLYLGYNPGSQSWPKTIARKQWKKFLFWINIAQGATLCSRNAQTVASPILLHVLFISVRFAFSL